MKKGKKREKKTCIQCGKKFSILPRTDGKGQREKCFSCELKHVWESPKERLVREKELEKKMIKDEKAQEINEKKVDKIREEMGVS